MRCGSSCGEGSLGKKKKKKKSQPALDCTLNKIIAVPVQRPSQLIFFSSPHFKHQILELGLKVYLKQ